MASVIKTYKPAWTLTDSLASHSETDPRADFNFYPADIPDKFTTTEQPKLKFTFTAMFFPRDEMRGNDLYFGNERMEEMEFALKQATRPQPTVEYKDVNFYNYRTKVATKVDYGQVSLTFYDDSAQRIHRVMQAYLNLISPISNLNLSSIDTIDAAISESAGSGYNSAGSMRELVNKYGLFKAIRVVHYHNYNGLHRKTYYDYFNPKIITFNPDDLDMTTSDVSNITLSFVYDGVNISENEPGGVGIQGVQIGNVGTR